MDKLFLTDTHEHLISEWDFEKNDKLGIKPSEVTAGSNKKVSWKCSKGHEWESQIAKRAIGRGCPVCSNKQVLAGYNDIATTNPELLKEWNYDRNNALGLYPTELTAGSSKKVWWKCVNGHEWQAQIKNKTRGKGCPACAGRIAIESVTDIKTTYPELLKEWNYEKNDMLGINPTNVSAGSGKKVWWKCSKGHEWEAQISKRTIGRGCPICSNKQVLAGYNDIAATNPEILKEWAYEINDKYGIKPTDVTAGSEKQVWWKCSKGHIWQTLVPNKVKGHGCTICAGKTVIASVNDILTTNSDIVKEWNYEKNSMLGLRPTDVTAGSNKKVWWKCQKGHEWQNKISQRTRGRGCPICSNKCVVEGFNDLAFLRPDILKEWDFEKNDSLGVKPIEITISSGKKVWWRCSECGHSWLAYVYSRTSGTDCPKCKKEHQTSFLEQAVFFYIQKLYSDAINGDRNIISPLELDIYIPSINTAIEYDGQAFHNNIQKDYKKNQLCIENGIRLIRIREERCPVLDCDERVKIYTYNHKDLDKFNEVISDIILQLSEKKCEFEIDVERDRDLIFYQYIKLKKENSIANRFPKLLDEWDYEENGVLNPELIACGSKMKVWWKCSKGHEWQSVINSRAKENKGTGCPFCSNQKILIGFNDLGTVFPELLKEWQYEKNDVLNIKPTEVTFGSGKKVWWKCSKGHEWQAKVCSRTEGGGCPVCANKQILAGYNDLATTNPGLMPEWNHEKNETLGLNPTEIYAGTKKRAWWKCSKGHEWQAEIVSRVRGGKCYVCTGNLVVAGVNDVATTYPDLMKEWMFDENIKLGIAPENVSAGCNKKVWWKCSKCGYQWQSIISNRARVKHSSGCPSCAGNMKKSE